MVDLKFCVFCGDVPENKNKEHILPQWLLRLTGDPKRTVSMYYDYRKGREVKFSWNSLVTPACEACNTEFAGMEAAVKPVIEGLLERKSLRARDYVLLLDWLDKVRVGLWLNYHMLQGDILNIKPSFYIKDRVARKDRFVAIYPLASDGVGLNAVGVNTLAFQSSPSVFGLRINNLLMINCSSDYIISGRCGFPSPTTMEILLDGENAGCLALSEFKFSKKIKTPLFRLPLAKPSVYILQPIAQRGEDGEVVQAVGLSDEKMADFFAKNLIDANVPEHGKLFRQFAGHVSRIDGAEDVIEFESIAGRECVTSGRLQSQIYEVQMSLQDLYTPISLNRDVRLAWNTKRKAIRNECKAYAKNCFVTLSRKV